MANGSSVSRTSGYSPKPYPVFSHAVEKAGITTTWPKGQKGTFMCDIAVLQVIEQKTQEKIGNGEMFTAYDITRAVRAQVGRSTNVAHQEVKQEVHGLFASGQFGVDYTRNLANLAGVNPQPWIYHRTTDDPTNYVSILGVANAPAADPASLTGISPPQDADALDDAINKQSDGAFNVDGRGTLCLPASLVRQAGLTALDEAYVAQDLVNNAVVLSKNEQPSLTQLAKYTVDKYINVRINQPVLQKAGLGGKTYDIEFVNGAVQVKKIG